MRTCLFRGVCLLCVVTRLSAQLVTNVTFDSLPLGYFGGPLLVQSGVHFQAADGFTVFPTIAGSNSLPYFLDTGGVVTSGNYIGIGPNALTITVPGRVMTHVAFPYGNDESVLGLAGLGIPYVDAFINWTARLAGGVVASGSSQNNQTSCYFNFTLPSVFDSLVFYTSRDYYNVATTDYLTHTRTGLNPTYSWNPSFLGLDTVSVTTTAAVPENGSGATLLA